MRFAIVLFLALIAVLSCSKEPSGDITEANYKFITAYSAKITVGGIVGVVERTFYVGEVFSGSDKGEANITLRIAKHTKNNENCPNPWCYQEFLEVPRTFLQLVP